MLGANDEVLTDAQAELLMSSLIIFCPGILREPVSDGEINGQSFSRAEEGACDKKAQSIPF